MRSIILLGLILSIHCVVAQKAKLIESDVFKAQVAKILKVIKHNNQYFLLQNGTVPLSGLYQPQYINHVDEKMNSITQVELPRKINKNTATYNDFYYYDGIYYVFFETIVKATGKNLLYCQQYEIKKGTWKTPVLISERNGKNRYNNKYGYFSVKKEQEHFLITTMGVSFDTGIRSFHKITISFSLNDKKEIFKKEEQGIMDYVFFQGSHYFLKATKNSSSTDTSKEKHPDLYNSSKTWDYVICKITNGKEEKRKITIGNFELDDEKLFVSNDQIGFMAEKESTKTSKVKEDKGRTFIVYNFTDFNRIKKVELHQKDLYSNDLNAIIKEVILYPSYFKVISEYDASKYNARGEIFYHKISYQGKVVLSKKINKYQYSEELYTNYYMSYKTVVKNDDIFIFFNDLERNINVDRSSGEMNKDIIELGSPYKKSLRKTAVFQMIKIDNTGKVHKPVVLKKYISNEAFLPRVRKSQVLDNEIFLVEGKIFQPRQNKKRLIKVSIE